MSERLRGLATLDALIALAVLMVVLGAVAPVAFGDQSFGGEARRRREAIVLAQQALVTVRAAARDDFGGVLPSMTEQDGFRITLEVAQTDHWTKQVRASVAWPLSTPSGRTRTVRLETLVTNTELEETCDSFPAGDWRRPRIATYALGSLMGDSGGTYPITGLDAYDGRLYVAASDSSVARPTLFAFDVSLSGAPTLLGATDNDAQANTGPSALVVAPKGGRIYAYLASASSFVRGQLQIADVTAPITTGWKPIIATYKIPTAAVPSGGLGNAIAYRHGVVYLGLTSSPGGTELNVIDVSDPSHPMRRGGLSFGSHAANGVAVRGAYAYVAHPTVLADAWPEQLTVFRVDDPERPVRAGGFYAAGGIGGNGKTVAVVGSRAYLGRTASRISGAADTLPELFALDLVPPSAGTPLAAAALATPESVNALIVRDRLAFALTSSQFQVWDFAAAALPAPGALVPAPRPYTPQWSATEFVSLPGRGTALDCEGDVMYVGSVDASNAGFISIITPS